MNQAVLLEEDETKLKWGDLVFDQRDRTEKKYFPAHEGQLDILNSDAKILLALGGINAGKTAIGMLWLCNEIAKHNYQGEYLMVATTYSVVLSSTKVRWFETIRDWKPFAGKWFPHQTNPRYELDSGAIVFFRSADGTFDGLKPHAIVLDEGGAIPLEQYQTVKRRMAQGSRLLITTTPSTSYDWIRTEIMEKADSGNPHFYYKELPSHLNPRTDKVNLEEERKSLEPWMFDMFYMGKFTRPPSLVYDFTGCYVNVEDSQVSDTRTPMEIRCSHRDSTSEAWTSEDMTHRRRWQWCVIPMMSSLFSGSISRNTTRQTWSRW